MACTCIISGSSDDYMEGRKVMKKDIIYVDRYEQKDTNDLLGEIFRLASNYNRFNNKMPEAVKMTAKQYYEIRNYKSDLFKEMDKQYYILGMRVVL